MKTIAIISGKGGAGRSTTSIHLAVEAESRGMTTAILDLDPQASAAGWADNRQDETPTVTSIQATRLVKTLSVARHSGAQLVIIDTAPWSADAAVTAAEQADLILIPCRPGIFDLRAIGATAKIAKLVGKKAFVVLNAVRPGSRHVVADAIEAVHIHGLEVSPFVIHQRASYSHALVSGCGAQEYEPHGKSASEIASLFTWVRAQIAC